MITPGHDYMDDVDEANQYITEPLDPAPKQKGRYQQDAAGRTVDKHDPEYERETSGFRFYGHA